jgi:cell wall-associated NlpC family hydrolase
LRTSGIASLLTLLTFSAASLASRADETLTLDLPASKPTVAAPASAAPLVSSSPAVSNDTERGLQTGAASGPNVAPGANAAKTDSGAFMEYSRSRAAKTTKPASRVSKGPSPRFSSRAGQSVNAKEKIVGRLGVTAHLTSIKAGRGSSKRTLAKAQTGTYLALNAIEGDWYGVLMADRSTGWIRKSDVKVLDYEVVAPKQSTTALYSNGSYSTSTGMQNTSMSGAAKSILQIAYGYIGVPYKWGGTSPDGLDCSAFVQRCFGSIGLRLPRTAREQINYGMPVTPEQLRPADRLYFASRGGNISHTGIYVGNGYFIHSSSSRKGVAVSNLSEPMYQRMFAGARR